jgi:hypothetical protein
MNPGSPIRHALECDQGKNAGPTDQEYGSQRNSGETYAPTRLERADPSDAELYLALKLEGRAAANGSAPISISF